MKNISKQYGLHVSFSYDNRKSDTLNVRFRFSFKESAQHAVIMQMACINETKFAEICEGIRADREIIIKHNPIGTEDEILLWMLLSCMVSYLSLADQETPCFTGAPNSNTYREAILFVLKGRAEKGFDPGPHIDRMLD